ncbi:VanZ family protein [Microbacterium sp. zg.Y625]|uniref:VanZ family protein n=1 Tax=Microbacterium jiangjiandongii TaxID=3049071 RepID=UPI00214D0989|nr:MULTISPECIES: VanZ family protein [unclassified Microbacterium]MCR2791525.1 VanZ family protein [Microbacterium sp. zg.Y625]WIM24354.1 VanZ family protein [Microbacterium sp. zg-Y625]
MPVRSRRGRVLLAAASALYLALLASLTLGPQPATVGGTLAVLGDWFAGWQGTAWLTFAVLEFVSNVVLFLPLGLLWVAWTGTRRWWLAALAGLFLSGAIEATQALALPDRYPDARDLVANTAGAALGAAGAAGADRVARRTRGQRRDR